MRVPRVLAVAGTRPDAIKLAPVVAALSRDGDLDAGLVVTGQHKEVLEQVMRCFDLEPRLNLELCRPGQSLASLTGRAIERLGPVIEEQKPDMILVQGDTTTTFAAALAAYYSGVPVGHVEAGLRTGDLSMPFPEEANRKLTATITSLHFAPTMWSRENLLGEGVEMDRIHVTGNTIIDALRRYLDLESEPEDPDLVRALRLAEERQLVIATSHRRENWGEPQRNIAAALADAARRFPDTIFLAPLHPNPDVRRVLAPPLAALPNVILSEPLSYPDMVHAMSQACLIVTDSGGMQEEGSALGVPVLVLREVTERPEGVSAGVVRLIGTDRSRVYDALCELLADARRRAEMARSSAVFGDGHASERIHAAVRRFLGLAAPVLPEFSAGGVYA